MMRAFTFFFLNSPYKRGGGNGDTLFCDIYCSIVWKNALVHQKAEMVALLESAASEKAFLT